MKKVRCSIAVIALILTLTGSILQGMGVGPLASMASSQHVISSHMAGPSSRLIAGQCPGGGSDDC